MNETIFFFEFIPMKMELHSNDACNGKLARAKKKKKLRAIFTYFFRIEIKST